VERFGWTFAPGDKVMQIENDYDKEVYNGDIGYVEGVDVDEGELIPAPPEADSRRGFPAAGRADSTWRTGGGSSWRQRSG
jgi:hypothetical protein